MRLMRNTSSLTILDDSTIVAIATPVGIGAISIVRLSGKDAYQIALHLTHRDFFKPRYAHLCSIYDTQGVALDEALVLYFPAPHSYTTQDVCEVQCHGGFVSARAIVEVCLALGARVASAGEFTKRAFLGGRLDLSQTQAIAGLIASQSLEANKILMRQLKGDVGIFVERIREILLEILALVEVNIDYSEEIEEDYRQDILGRLEQIRDELKQVYESSLTRSGLIEGYTLSIIGKPNVGKSSLLNALLMYERAIVSATEGTTRDTIEENLHINGALVRIVDTAGIRQSDDEIERIGITKTKEALQRSDMILALFDASRPFDEKDAEVLDILKAYADKYILVILNKTDLPKQCDEAYLRSFLHTYKKAILPTPLAISAQKQGAQEVIESLKEVINLQNGNQSLILTSSYAISCVKNALDSIHTSYEVFENEELELFAYHIKDALQSISSITHPYESAELLDKLFGTFCLGK